MDLDINKYTFIVFNHEEHTCFEIYIDGCFEHETFFKVNTELNATTKLESLIIMHNDYKRKEKRLKNF